MGCRRLRLCLAALVIAGACKPAVTRVCDPGAVQACQCADGKESTLTCWYDGTRWSDCHCAQAAASGGSSSRAEAGLSSSGPPPPSSSLPTLPDGGACLTPAPAACPGGSPDGMAHVLVTAGSGPRGIAGLVEVGMTRAEVAGAIGDTENILEPDALAGSALQAAYCNRRLVVEYADTPSADGGLEGHLTDNDRVVRIRTLDGFMGHTDLGLAHGTTRSAAWALYNGDAGPLSNDRDFPGGLRDLWPLSGVAAEYGGGAVRSVTVHRPHAAAVSPVIVPNFAARQFSVGGTTLSARMAGFEAGASTFADVRAALGPPDEEGIGKLSGYSIAEMSYVSLGIRFAANAAAGAFDAQQVFIVLLIAPFQGLDPAGALGLGSTRQDWDGSGLTPLGPFTFGGLALERYRVGSLFGGLNLLVAVYFQRDAACDERAVAIVVNPPAI